MTLPTYIGLAIIAIVIVGFISYRIIVTPQKNKPKPVKVKTTVKSSISNEEKVVEVSPEDYKKENGGIPAGMPSSFAVCTDDD